MEYVAVKTQVINPAIDSAEWERANVGVITDCGWGDAHRSPETTFKMLYSDEGISVLMHTAETNLRSCEKTTMDPICHDSCMEFFFKPDPYDKRYINFEVNPAGVMHVGIGSDRFDRELIHDYREMLSIESNPVEGDWTVKFYLPYEFLKKFFKDVAPVCRANFYKCGARTDHPHHGAWAKVETVKPDFHVADFFDKIRFE